MMLKGTIRRAPRAETTMMKTKIGSPRTRQYFRTRFGGEAIFLDKAEGMRYAVWCVMSWFGFVRHGKETRYG